MAAVSKGTAPVYGISGSVTNLTVQSYTVTRSFENDDKVAGEHGRTITHRLDGRTNGISIEGVLQSSTFSVAIGDRDQFVGTRLPLTGS